MLVGKDICTKIDSCFLICHLLIKMVYSSLWKLVNLDSAEGHTKCFIIKVPTQDKSYLKDMF